MKKLTLLFLITASLMGVSSPAPAAVLLEYNFDDLVPEASEYAVYKSSGADTTNVTAIYNIESTAYFTGNNAYWRDTSKTYGRNVVFALSEPAALMTLSFDFRLYIQDPDSAAAFSFASGVLSSNPNAANRVASGIFSPLGVIGSESDTGVSGGGSPVVGTAYLFYNGSTGDESYYNPVLGSMTTLTAGQYMAFLYDNDADTWTESTGTATSTAPITRVAFYNSNGGRASLQFDNLLVVDGLTLIPEPSTYALAGAAGLAGLLACRRRLR